jgi:pimeloyl-ACP methyl ester carboxylesterase
VAAPTLVFAGRKDLFAPPEVQERMHELVPQSEIVWFEEGGHMLPAEEPQAIAAGMLEFMARRARVATPAAGHPR